MAPCFNQLAMMTVQIVMNNVLTRYGAASSYGSDIPLACAGIITKVNMIFFSVNIGISQGLQPIISFNYGAEKLRRVKEAYLKAIASATLISTAAFLCFQFFPGRSSGFSAPKARHTTSLLNDFSGFSCFALLSMEFSLLHRISSRPSEKPAGVSSSL